MTLKSSERPIWLWPLLGLLVPIWIGGIFFFFQWAQWLVADKQRNIVENPKLSSRPIQPTSAPIAAAPERVSTEAHSTGLPASEVSLYVSEINNLRIKAEEYVQAVEKVRKLDASRAGVGIGSGESIKADAIAKYQAQASHKASVAACLENQRKLGITFYQGMATCAAALPLPITPQLN